MEGILSRIKEIRTAKKISQEEISKHLGITQAAYAKVESSKSITVERLYKIAELLNVSIGDLLNMEPTKTDIDLIEKNRQLNQRLSELEDQLNDKKELLRYYQQSYTVTERMIIIQAEDFHKLCPDVAFSINAGELRNRAMMELQREYPDLFIIKPPFLLRKGSENTNSK